MLLDQPPSLDAREITDKGSINQKVVLQQRAALVDELYAPTPSARVLHRCPTSHMTNRIDAQKLVAFDVHVHLEQPVATPKPTRRPRNTSKAARLARPSAMADYYRSRNMAFIVFTVDETLSGMKRFTNDEVVEFAQQECRRRDSVCQHQPEARRRGACAKRAVWWRPGRSGG